MLNIRENTDNLANFEQRWDQCNHNRMCVVVIVTTISQTL